MSIHLSIHPPPGPLRPEICPQADFRPERIDFRPERVDFRPERVDFRPERAFWGQTNRRMDGWTNKSPLVFFRTLSPLRPLPCFPSVHFKFMQSREIGIADHILPLGDLSFIS